MFWRRWRDQRAYVDEKALMIALVTITECGVAEWLLKKWYPAVNSFLLFLVLFIPTAGIILSDSISLKEVSDMFKRLASRFFSRRAELDEKALLIALFVLAAIVTLTPLGNAVAAKFQQIMQKLG